MIPNKKYLDYEGLKYYNSKLNQHISQRLNTFEASINESISELENMLRDNISQVENSLQGDISELESSLQHDINDLKTSILEEFTLSINLAIEDIYNNINGSYYNS